MQLRHESNPKRLVMLSGSVVEGQPRAGAEVAISRAVRRLYPPRTRARRRGRKVAGLRRPSTAPSGLLFLTAGTTLPWEGPGLPRVLHCRRHTPRCGQWAGGWPPC